MYRIAHFLYHIGRKHYWHWERSWKSRFGRIFMTMLKYVRN